MNQAGLLCRIAGKAARLYESVFTPVTACCSGLHCRGYQQLLPIGGFDPAYFEGATAILAEACNFDFPPCQPNEPIRLEAANAAAPAPGVG
jgi:hypothetical protein